jgi:hypothetical protein
MGSGVTREPHDLRDQIQQRFYVAGWVLGAAGIVASLVVSEGYPVAGTGRGLHCIRAIRGPSICASGAETPWHNEGSYGPATMVSSYAPRLHWCGVDGDRSGVVCVRRRLT